MTSLQDKMILSPNETKLLSHIGTHSPIQKEALLATTSDSTSRAKMESLLQTLSKKGLVSDNNEGGLFLSDKGEEALLSPNAPEGTFKSSESMADDMLLKGAFEGEQDYEEEGFRD